MLFGTLTGRGLSDRLREASELYASGMRNVVSSLAREDVGWRGFGDDEREIVPLPVIKDHSRRARHLVAYNPLVKRGITIRNAYMWHDLPVASRSLGKLSWLTSLESRMRDESALCTDGAVFYMVNKRTKEVRPVPLSRISSVARDRDASDEGDIYAVLVEPVPLSDQIGIDNRKPEWYLVDGKPYSKVSNAQGYATNRQWTIVYAVVNRQVGEVWGKPDLMGAVYWARAYKTYLEASHTMTQALARIAFKVNSVTRQHQQAVIQQMGNGSGIGGTASLGPGQELTAVNKAGAGIDMTSGTPLAAMVSAALDVPLSVLLTDGSAGGRQGAETALEEPTFKAFEIRRRIHVDLITRVLRAVGISSRITIVPLSNELVQRWSQAVALGYQNGMLHQVEARQLFLDRFAPSNAKAVNDLPEVVGTGGAGVGPLSDGTNANRDEDGGETVA